MTTEEVLKRLPPPALLNLGGEPEFYGAASIVAALCGRRKIRPYAPKAWLHGWIYKPVEQIREILFWSEKSDVNLLHTQEQVDFVKSSGYEFSYAIGAPFIYTAKSGHPRWPSSILVMPPHSTKSALHVFDERSYLDAMSDVLPHFKHVMFCLHPHDAESGAWKANLKKMGYPWISGATAEDANALHRMRCLFESFEYVTSPNLGSHIPFAAYCGCKVSVFGPRPNYDAEMCRKDVWSQKNWGVVEANLAWVRSNQEKVLYPELFTDPIRAKNHSAWASAVLGAGNKKDPNDLRRLFGWCLKDQLSDFRMGKRYAHEPWVLKLLNLLNRAGRASGATDQAV